MIQEPLSAPKPDICLNQTLPLIHFDKDDITDCRKSRGTADDTMLRIKRR